jgi:ATP-dependent 26S proteasome regulatory subunit
MPKVDHLAKLLKAVAAEDWSSARAAGARIAEAEEEKGHHAAAQHLRGALHPNGHRVLPSKQSNGEWLADPGLLATALTRLSSKADLSEVSLRTAQRDDIAELMAEWKHRDALATHGLAARRKLLFHGPPGCGKSLTAHALGNALSLPTYVVRIDAVVGAFLGQTALRIRELFHFAEHTACVLLLDEIDALGKRRGNQLDVGELDRVVISLMQELEHTTPRGLLVATSNLPQHLDDALFRRFDHVIEFPRPSRSEVLQFAAHRAKTGGVVSPRALPRVVAGAKSYADAERRIVAQERALLVRQMTR